MNFPILIHFKGKKQLPFSQADVFCTSNLDISIFTIRYENFTKWNAILMISTLLLRDLLKGFIGLPFGFWLLLCALCGMAYADWVPHVHFNHKSFYFLWTHLFHSKSFMYFFFYAYSLVFHYDEYDGQVRSSSAPWSCSEILAALSGFSNVV